MIRASFCNVLLKPAKQETTKSGLVLPETKNETIGIGEVLDIGPGDAGSDAMYSTPKMKAWGKVLYIKNDAHEVTIDGEKYIFVDFKSIVGTL